MTLSDIEFDQRRSSRRRSASKAMRMVLAASVSIATLLASPANSQDATLEEGFREPPMSARPRVWWHWMNGNVTEGGIRKDIEWMSRIGLGGMQNFDATVVTPQIVDKRLVYMSPEWKQAFRFAASEAQKHGLELATASSPGWSETGGPWVKPEDGMKKLVWSELTVDGSRRFTGPLPSLPGTTGKFQDIEAQHDAFSPGQDGLPFPQHSADIAVLAYRTPASWEPLPAPQMMANGKDLPAATLIDGLFGDGIEIPRPAQANREVLAIDFGSPRTIRSLTYQISDTDGMPVLEAEDRGGNWRRIAQLAPSPIASTISFAPVTATRFRMVLGPPAQGGGVLAQMGDMTPGVDIPGMLQAFGPKGATAMMGGGARDTIRIAEFSLQTAPKVNAFEKKAGFAIANDYYALDGDTGPEVAGIEPADVMNLTDRVSADGHLDWTPPKGRWTIVRLGYSLTGTMNHPATREATGLEVDKYDGDAVERYLKTYIGMYADATGKDLIGHRGLRAIVTDSTEIGPSNWTPRMLADFRTLRGYDPTPWLPALTGTIVASRRQSDAFLYDYRRTLSDLMSREHYGTIARVAHENDLTYYGEALETSRIVLGDDMAMRAHADIPMSMSGAEIDMRGAASVAHIYGQNLVAAESLTNALAPWATSPSDLRAKMDFAFVSGVNRAVIHTSVHQPTDDKKPGLALLIFGQYFNRHETWAEMAKPWVDYLARSSFLLQQGRNQADVAYFYGEEAPLVGQFTTIPEDAPRHYGFDFINADALSNALTVEGKDIVTPGGARYKVLYLGGTSHRMTASTLRRIVTLVQAGATVVGQPPQDSPALGDDPAEFADLVKRLWGNGQGAAVGTGRVIGGKDIESALASIGVTRDFAYEAREPGAAVLFQHRTLPDGEIYYLSNRSVRLEHLEARFRVTDKTPEIWRADTGAREPVSYRVEAGETIVSMDMAPTDSFFVVFEKPLAAPSATIAAPVWTTLKDIGDGPWEVHFEPGRGAPAQTRLQSLRSLSTSDLAGIKYFSGVATYSKAFDLPAAKAPYRRLMLDLGEFGDVAEVRVNGTLAGTVWREPHRVEIDELVKPGRNTLEVKVANRWINRLIGDAQPGAQKVTWTSTPTYSADAPLRLSGLVGPVQLLVSNLDP